MSSNSEKYKRRSFLKALGVSGLLLPLFNFELEGQATAQNATVAKRFATFCWPDGVTNNYWPTGTETNFTLTDVTSPLEPVKDDILILDGIDNKVMMDQFPTYGGHAAMPHLLTGNTGKYYLNGDAQSIGDAISLDQFLAQSQTTPYKSLVLGVDNRDEGNPADKYLSLSGPAIGDQPNAPAVQDDVHALYTQLFSGASVDSAALVKLRAERKSVLDFVGADLEKFGAKLGSDNKQKLQLHLQSVRDLETRLDAVPTTYKAKPDDPSIVINRPQDYDKIVRAQIDMIVGAFASGQTNIATLLASNSHNNMWVFYWLGGDFAQPGDGSFNPLRSQHEMAHRGGDGSTMNDDQRRKDALDKYFVSLFAYFIQSCKAIPELNGTMLDNTVLLNANVMGNGASHSNQRLPWILAGKGGGYFRTGRLIKAPGTPHNRVLTSIANAMGSNVTEFGKSGYGGPLTQLQ